VTNKKKLQIKYVQDCSKAKKPINHDESLNKLGDEPTNNSSHNLNYFVESSTTTKEEFLPYQAIHRRDPLIRENPVISFLPNSPTTSQPNCVNTLTNFFSKQISITKFHSMLY
jgi:hypothetical protein